MILSEILDSIKATIRRPDKDDDINRYTISALRALHSVVEFENDYTEWLLTTSNITYDSNDSSVGQVIYPRDVRIPKILVAQDATGARIADIELINAREVTKRQSANISVENTAYKQGNHSISFNCSSQPSTFILGGYTHRPEFAITNEISDGTTKAFTDPDLLAYSTWLTDIYETVVIDYVIGYVAARLGEKDISSTHLAIYQSEHLPNLMQMGKS